MERTDEFAPSPTPGRRRRRAGMVAAAVAAAAAVLLPATASYADVSITVPTGPLTNITTSTTLNCAVNYLGDAFGEFYDDTACGTFVVVGGTLYGPADVPAGDDASPRTPYTLVSQSGPTGTGTGADPYTLTTVVQLGATGVRLTQIDSYVAGQESYRTTVTVQNNSGSSISPIIYRAGDCFLQDSDDGTGAVNATPTGNAVSCVAPSGRIEQWYPLTPGSHYMEAGYSEVWARIGSRQPFPDTCRCDEDIDNGAGLSWSQSVPAGGSTTVSHLTVFSPLGVQPISTSKVADDSEVLPSASDGYTITLTNHNDEAAEIDAVTDVLPPGFRYTAGSTSGATTADPLVTALVDPDLVETLTWNGPFTIPAATGAEPGEITLHFSVTVSDQEGAYLNDATGVDAELTVAPSGPTAQITVSTPDPPSPPTSRRSTTTTATSTPRPAAVTVTPRFTG